MRLGDSWYILPLEHLSFFPPKQALSSTPLASREGSQRLTWNLSRTQLGVETSAGAGDSGISGAGSSCEKGCYTAGREEAREETKTSLRQKQKRKDTAQETLLDLETQCGSPPVLKDVRNPTGLLQSDGRSSLGPRSALAESES